MRDYLMTRFPRKPSYLLFQPFYNPHSFLLMPLSISSGPSLPPSFFFRDGFNHAKLTWSTTEVNYSTISGFIHQQPSGYTRAIGHPPMSVLKCHSKLETAKFKWQYHSYSKNENQHMTEIQQFKNAQPHHAKVCPGQKTNKNSRATGWIQGRTLSSNRLSSPT